MAKYNYITGAAVTPAAAGTQKAAAGTLHQRLQAAGTSANGQRASTPVTYSASKTATFAAGYGSATVSIGEPRRSTVTSPVARQSQVSQLPIRQSESAYAGMDISPASYQAQVSSSFPSFSVESSPASRVTIESTPTSRITVDGTKVAGVAPSFGTVTYGEPYRAVAPAPTIVGDAQVAGVAPSIGTVTYGELYRAVAPAPTTVGDTQVAAVAPSIGTATYSISNPVTTNVTLAPAPMPTTVLGAAPIPTLLSGQPLASAASRDPKVEYFSNSRGGWIPAIFKGFNTEFNTYTLDVQPYAKPGDVRLAPGAAVEYHSQTRDVWMPATMEAFNEEFGTYALDIKPYAKPEDVRLAGFPEALQAPCLDCGDQPRRAGDPGNRVNKEPEPVEAPKLVEVMKEPEPIEAPKLVEVMKDEMDVEVEEPDDPHITALVNSLGASDRFPVGARVEYFSTKGWLAAKVLGFNDQFGTYTLDIQPYALAGMMRRPGSVEVVKESRDGEESGEGLSEEKNPSSIPQFTVQQQRVGYAGGRETFAVFIEANDGVQVRAFDKDCTEFEIRAQAEPLRTWLEGITNDLMPGLMTLLQHEVASRHERLMAMEAEKDSYKGLDDIEFFGLGEDFTDKDIDRAYRERAKTLHPDKGGDEDEFADMKKRYDQLKKNRGDGSKKMVKVEGDPLSWDPCDRGSMLTAHDKLREYLHWVTNDLDQISKDLEELRRRHTAAEADRRSILNEGDVPELAQAAGAPTVMQPSSSQM